MGGSRQRTLLRQVETESDEQLTERVRDGDEVAYSELYRRHRKAAESTARYLLRSRADADDVVADAFAGVLSAIRNGRGPRDNFRRYLLASVRNGCRVRQRTVPFAPEHRQFHAGRSAEAPVLEDPERYVEADTVARAFAALSPRWQQMLWSTAVEQKTAQEVGEQLRMSPNAAAALAHRAREAFATAYLSEHLGTHTSGECSRFAPHLAGLVRGQLPPGRSADVERHVAECLTCSTAVADLRDVNTSLRTLAPAPGTLVPVGAELTLAPGGASSAVTGTAGGLPVAGLAVKGLAGVLLLAPILMTNASGFDGGIADGIREPAAMVVDEQADVPTTPPDQRATTVPVVAVDVTEPPAVADDARGDERDDADELETSDDAAETDADGADDEAAGAPDGGPGEAGAPAGDGGAVPGEAPVAPATTAGAAPAAPTVPAPRTTEGLLGTLGVDDALDPVGLAVVSDTVDAAVYSVTSSVVAPLIATALESLGLPLDLSELPPVPGVVLSVPTTVAAALGPGTTLAGGDQGPMEPTFTVAPLTVPIVTLPDATLPVVTLPPGTAPPATGPPATSPPATPPPATSPPATSPPATSPPATSPPATSPPPTTNPGLLCTVLGVVGLC